MSTARPEIKITLDKPRTMRLDLNAMALFEEATGKSLFNLNLSKSLGAIELRALLWACLVHEDETLTLKQVGGWITTENMEEVARNANAALSNAVGDAREKPADPLPTPPIG